MTNKKRNMITICWECKKATNASGECSWAMCLKPVVGWDAVLQHTVGGGWSYVVLGCPLFEQDRVEVE